MIRYARTKDRDALLEMCLTSMAMKEKPYLEYYFLGTGNGGEALSPNGGTRSPKAYVRPLRGLCLIYAFYSWYKQLQNMHHLHCNHILLI